MLKKIKLIRTVAVIAILAFGFSLIGCEPKLNWHESPDVDLNSLPRVEVPVDASTMEIEEDGKTLEFKIIRTFEDLDNIRNDIEDDRSIRKNYILANSIDLKDRVGTEDMDRYFRPIEGYFLGIFDGNNNCIRNLKFISELQSVPAALFERIGDRDGGFGTVKNLITSGNASAINWAAPIAYTNYGIIENCINFANVIASGGMNGLIFGGIAVQNMESGIIRNCVNYGQIGVLGDNGARTGGIAGNNAGIIDNCINYGTVLGGRDSGYGVGGIAGTTSSSTINNCVNYGTIIGVNIDKDSGIVSVFTSLNGKPYPEKPTGNKNYGSVIVIKK